MTQKNIQLLLKDLSARLFYGVMCQVDDGAAGLNDGKLIEIDVSKELVRFDADYYWDAWIDDVKPYLRPMLSMTEEEKEEIKPLFSKFIDEFGKRVLVVRQNKMALYIDWLNAHHFDYRGLIEKGLALEVPEGMYD